MDFNLVAGFGIIALQTQSAKILTTSTDIYTLRQSVYCTCTYIMHDQTSATGLSSAVSLKTKIIERSFYHLPHSQVPNL